MADPGEQRRLAAIFAADMVGYSRLMEADERGTIARQKAYRAELIDPAITKHHGRIVKLMGDGMLVEFASVVDAVECAVALQRAMAEREAEVPDDRRIQYRVGVNLGDIVIEDEDIFGDGVNIAARLQELAEPGGICISGTAYDQLKQKVEVGYQFLGERQVKNIVEPVRVYRALLDPEDAGKVVGLGERRRFPLLASAAAIALLIAVVGGGAWWWKPWIKRVEPADPAKMTFTLSDKPSIAVLPFDNLTGVPDRQFLIDGFVEQLTTALSRHPDILVISRGSSFSYRGKNVPIRQIAEELGVRYVIEGSLQQAAGRIRINVQLIDAIKGFHAWSKAYDRPAPDFFTVQDDVIGAISVELLGRRGEILVAEHQRIHAKRSEDLSLYELGEKANVAYGKTTSQDNERTREFKQQMLDLEPDNARAHAFMAWVEPATFWYRWTEDRDATLKRACDWAEKAVALDRREYQGHWAAAWCYWSTNRPDESRRAFEAALRLNPAEPSIILQYATNVMLRDGRVEEAISKIKMIERTNPKGRINDKIYNALSTLVSTAVQKGASSADL